MKNDKNILKVFCKSAVCGLAVLCLFTVKDVAAELPALNGCEKDENNYINPTIALCTTHAYNRGMNTNPKTENDKQLMRDIVRLKTTVITQQMKKQYDYLDGTLRRLKTQLEKAVLTARLEAAGVPASSGSGPSSSGGASKDSNVVISGAKNCYLIETNDLVARLNCIQSNVQLARNALMSGNIGDAYKQLKADSMVAKSFGAGDANNDICHDMKRTRDSVADCANKLTAKLVTKINEESRRYRPY